MQWDIIADIDIRIDAVIGNMGKLQISSKDLGALALPNFCPRCFWLKMHCDRLPFQFFPGIFSSIDSYSKKITLSYYEKHRELPRWFEGFGKLGEPVKVPHHSKFCIIDDETEMKLTGVPDEILHRSDNSYFIIDYKTARYTSGQDALLPMYEVQLNGYAYIAERTGFKPVTGLGLIYYEPQTDILSENIDTQTMDGGFTMHFHASLHPISLKPDILCNLLKKAREIIDLQEAPPVSAGCRDCSAVESIVTNWSGKSSAVQKDLASY